MHAKSLMGLRAGIAASMTVLATAACSRAPRSESPVPAGPTIESLAPADGPAGTAYPIQITLVGTGFAAEGNTVTFGGIRIPDVPSQDDGTRITFFAPKERPGGGEVPPFVLTPGEYEVTVTTSRGTSNSVAFTLTRGS